MTPRRRIEIYTDGSCLKNPDGPGGYAAIILIDGLEVQRLTGSDPSTTSNRMEMMAAITGLEAMRQPSPLTIYSDSQLVINCASGKWKRKKNKDLWQRLDSAAARHQVKWRWVRGHSGDAWNELADRLCGLAARNRYHQEENRAAEARQRAYDREMWSLFDKF